MNHSTDQQLVWAAIERLILMQQHFNTMQHHYRALASTWLLAFFAGAGWTLSKSVNCEVGGVPTHVLLSSLALSAAIGSGLLWSLDIHVYFQLLRSCFKSAHELEKELMFEPLSGSEKKSGTDPKGWLKVHQHMQMFDQSRTFSGVRERLSFYYVATSGAPVALVGLFVGVYGTATGAVISWVLLAIAAVIPIGMSCRTIITSRKEREERKERKERKEHLDTLQKQT